MENRKLNWGIIGTGWIASEMAEALLKVNGEIYAVAATSLKKAEDFAEKYGVKNAYGLADELFENPEVDIVYIATPHISHYELMKKALEAGKNVFAEKSITTNSRQLEECEKIASEKNLVISDGTTLLHMPLYRRLRRMIDEGIIGKVKMVQVNFGSHKEFDPNNRFFSKDLAGGALLDIGVYAVSFARYFMESQPDVIMSTVCYFETGVDQSSGIILKNAEEQMAVIALTLMAKQPKRGVIAGEKGYIEINEYPRADKARIVMTEDGSEEIIEAGNSSEALEYEVQDMQDYVCHQDGKQNLGIVSDVMRILSAVRNQWGMKYPSELD